jgi:head-tail adaptor
MKNIILKERVSLLSAKTIAGKNGAPQKVYESAGFSWANIAAISRRKLSNFKIANAAKAPETRVYRVVIRERLDIEKKVESASRHKKINALRWKRKYFDLLVPFSPLDEMGKFWESVCVESEGGGSS